jgi:3-oxoacyl-[acyl-carrier protein] reductase
MIDLNGKVALVTGGGRGIGLATAELLAAHGARVMINGVGDAAALVKTAADIEKRSGRTCWAVTADAADAEAVSRLYKDLLQRAGRLDVLVANAGVLEDARIGMISEAQIDHTLGVNVKGLLHHIQLATRLMAHNDASGGSVIAMSSIIGRAGNAGQMLYGASKAAILGAVQSAAKELAPQQIRVNAIAPGFIDTAMTQTLPAAIRTARLASIGMGRIGTPHDVARAALFLASDLSAYITGQVIGVDGGMVI